MVQEEELGSVRFGVGHHCPGQSNQELEGARGWVFLSTERS